MTHARWWRDATVLVLALGLVSGVAFLRMSPVDGGFGWGQGALLLVATAGLWALLSLPFVQRTLRADSRLRSGDGALAGWTLTPTEWNQFVVAERERSAAPGAPTNLVSTARRVPPRGVEVIIARWRSLPLALGFHVATNIVQEITGLRPSAASILAAEYPVGSAAMGQAILVSIALLNLTVALLLLFQPRRSRGLTTA